nr:hypothetical protein [Tanacetum cinerariifolium]
MAVLLSHADFAESCIAVCFMFFAKSWVVVV